MLLGGEVEVGLVLWLGEVEVGLVLWLGEVEVGLVLWLVLWLGLPSRLLAMQLRVVLLRVVQPKGNL
jgi:hypothetical protein